MKDQLEIRIENVCNDIDAVFKNNEPERVRQILRFAEIVGHAPNSEALERAVGMVEQAIQVGIHAAKVKMIDDMQEGKRYIL